MTIVYGYVGVYVTDALWAYLKQITEALGSNGFNNDVRKLYSTLTGI